MYSNSLASTNESRKAERRQKLATITISELREPHRYYIQLVALTTWTVLSPAKVVEELPAFTIGAHIHLDVNVRHDLYTPNMWAILK